MSHQLSHLENKFCPRSFSITIVCDHLKSPANQGALFRICDAFGISQIIFFGNTIDFNSSRLKRTARNTEKKIAHKTITDKNEIVAYLKKSEAQIIGLEITDNSLSLKKFESLNKELIIIIGNEKSGISSEILSHVKQVFHIPMYGANSSMNVIQATGITLYEVTNKLNI